MRKPLTGEPYAGEPPVRFGGRGGKCLSYPLSERVKLMPGYNVAANFSLRRITQAKVCGYHFDTKF